ncbi:MAG TPA: thiamine ABC transporter ATP-binding protein [Thermopetrobacter sp.]|nr:thiamine ABC transporter ATP-binding protein [Thermopetrobacter sp.]
MTGLAVTLREVRFHRGEWRARFDLSVPAGALVAVLGPSGAGKSTLLDLIAGFEVPDAGRILFGDADLTCAAPAERPVSMIFQENNLFAHLDVETNVALGIDPRGRLDAAGRERIRAILADMGLVGMERRFPAQLSGGQRQRVALARALLRDAPVMLLDEPFGALDPRLRAEMLSLLRRLHAARGMTVLFVTHLPQDAAAIASHVVRIEDGRIAGFAAVTGAPGTNGGKGTS